jgi:hypothetical protein
LELFLPEARYKWVHLAEEETCRDQFASDEALIYIKRSPVWERSQVEGRRLAVRIVDGSEPVVIIVRGLKNWNRACIADYGRGEEDRNTNFEPAGA